MFLLAAKNLLRRKGIASLALLGVGLGSALIIVLLAVSGGLDRNLDQTVGALAGKLVVSPKDALFGGIFFSSGTPLPAGDLDAVRSLPGVRAVYGRVTASLTPAGSPELMLPLTGYGREETDSSPYTPFAKIIQGRAPGNDREIIIGQSLYSSLSFIGRRLEVGQTYPFLSPDGIHAIDLRVTGIYRTGDEITDTAVAGTESLARRFDSLPYGEYSSLAVRVDDPGAVLPVQGAILRDLAGRGPAVQVVAPENLLDPLQASMRVVSRFLLVLGSVFALGCAVFISIIMSIIVLERMKEFGVLKAVGWRGGHVTVLVLLESLLLSAAGTMFGTALGYGTSLVAAWFLKSGPDVPSTVTLLRIAVLAVGVGTLGGIYPAWRANRAAPAEIFRHG